MNEYVYNDLTKQQLYKNQKFFCILFHEVQVFSRFFCCCKRMKTIQTIKIVVVF